MFRTLATRLTASYVFAAIVLVVIVAIAVTAFSLSMFALGSKETMETVARDVPEEARIQVARYGSLEAAAPDIIQHLARPGVRIAIVQTGKRDQRFIAGGGLDDEGKTYVRTFPAGPPSLAAAPVAIPNGFGLFGYGEFGPKGSKNASQSEAVPVLRAIPGPAGPNGPGAQRHLDFVYRAQPEGQGDTRSPFEPPPGFKGKPFPLGLNWFMHIGPRRVAIAGGIVEIIPDPRPLSRAIDSFWTAMLPIGFFVVLAAWFLGRFITGQALRPLVETTAALNRFADGDFTPRSIVTSDRSEIGELVGAYNGAVAQVSAAFEERRSVELQMRQFIADAGHELRTPLTVIMGFIDVLRRRASHDTGLSTKIYDTMLFESRRMRALIDKLIVLARLENPQLQRTGAVDVGEIASRIVSAQEALGAKPRVRLRSEPGTIVRADEDEIYEAISNLVENALKYAPLSPVDVSVRTDGSDALIEVADRGPGLDREEQERVFDRFYRGENGTHSEGFGLGLAIVKRAVERAGGRITLESRSGEGCRFTIRIPLEGPGEQAGIAV